MPTPKPGHREGVRRYARAGQTTLPIRGTLVVAGPWQGWKVCPTCGRIYHPDALTCGNYCPTPAWTAACLRDAGE